MFYHQLIGEVKAKESVQIQEWSKFMLQQNYYKNNQKDKSRWCRSKKILSVMTKTTS